MIIYASRTGNVKYIVSKLNLPNKEISTVDIIDCPFIIFTYTDKIGQIPTVVDEFLKLNHSYCKGVIVSGNSNWGSNYCKAGDLINEKYNVPIIRKLEVRGFEKDYEYIIDEYNKLAKEW